MTWVRKFGWLAFLIVVPAAFSQIQVGETELKANGNYSVGYSGTYGDAINSTHGLDIGFSNDISGSYYNPNFLNFQSVIYYDQSRDDSTSQSLTNSSGIEGTANLFSGSHYPGTISYRYDRNTTGTNGLEGTPNFTTVGNGDGIGINWSALVPNMPTLSVGFQHGSGSGTLYGTSQDTSTDQNLLNVHSTYRFDGFQMNGYYDHTSLSSEFPEFLSGTNEQTDSSGQDFGINTNRSLPLWHGSFYAGYSHSSYTTDFSGTDQNDITSGYSANMESAGASFHPTEKFFFSLNQNYTSNLSAYLNQTLVSSGPNVTPVVNLGDGSYSDTYSGTAGYQFTKNLGATGQITRYDQSYFGQTYSGTFMSGYVTYGKKILDLFNVSAGVVDSSINFGGNTVGFVGNLSYFHRFGGWETSGNFSYAQNVQSVLITETTSYYSYNANLHRKFSPKVQWTAAFNGSHSGLSTQSNGSSGSEGFSTTLSLRKIMFAADYMTGTGNSVYTAAGIVGIPVLPGENSADVIAYNSKGYGGSISVSPFARMVITGTYNRSLSNTLSFGIPSRNDTEIIFGQMQYRLRRISLLAGYTRFSQGFTALGPTAAPVTSYYAGISRWFNFF